MIQLEFALKAQKALSLNPLILGLAAGGSWISNELDEFSDLDLVIVTEKKVGNDITKMKEIAHSLGELLSCFIGDHVGEPRLLICLYNNPLLHVDLKYVTISEFKNRVEDPVILLDHNNLLKNVIETTDSTFPKPDFQWIEDRFWVWVHYALLKLGRGEYLEALDFLGFLRMVVIGPLVHIKNQNFPRGVRKVEQTICNSDFEKLKKTIGTYEKKAILKSLKSCVEFYVELRSVLFDKNKVLFQNETEKAVKSYFDLIENH